MDAIEVSRQTAARLHIAAVKNGRDPYKPYAFALAEADRRGLAVEKVPTGDVRLHGGKALYDPDALLIVHENANDDFMHAFLIAHEIGHVELGGHAEAFTTVNADPLRSWETSVGGIDRVVDYNRRQRREVQMDLFAREFLLPRSVVRRLHVEEGIAASDIAARLGAPFSVVAQQLFDALLLPEIELPSAEQRIEKPLNPGQIEAVKHRGTPYLLEAGPGTGKTQTLVARVEDLLTTSVDPSRMLVLTFSNKAAGELSERIAAKRAEAAAAMWIGTFHAFGLDVVRRFHDRLRLPAEPRLLDRSEAIEFLEDEFPRLRLVYFKELSDPSFLLSDILSAISRAKDEVIDAAGYRLLGQTMLETASTGEQREAAKRSLDVATVFTAYEKLKIDHGYVDFGDLVSMPVRLCESDAEVSKYLAMLYEHVLVDEFQDVNRSSIRLLKALTGNGQGLWVVGDAKQSIYRFRGASSFNVARFGVEDFPGGKRGRLSVNYRSVEEIKNTFVQFASGMVVTTGSDICLEAKRGKSNVAPEHRIAGTAEEEIAAVGEAIEEMRLAGHGFRNQALLCSGNDRLAKFAAGLEGLGIPVLYLGSLFERDEIKDLLSLLSMLIDRRAMGLLRVAAKEEHEVSLSDVASVLSYLKDHGSQPLIWAKHIEKVPGLSVEGGEGLRRIAGLLDGFTPSDNAWNVLATVLLDRTRITADIAGASDVAARSRGIAIWQFMNFLRSQPSGQGLPISRLLERIRRLVLLSDERELRQLPAAAQGIDAVRLMTIHGSKGLEFPVVHIPSLNDGTLPRSAGQALARGIAPPDGLIEGALEGGADAARAAHVEEQECLFFVALSRARDRLLFYSSSKKANGHRWAHSPFLDRLGGTICSNRVTPGLVPPQPGEPSIPVTFIGSFAVTDYQLGLYQRCPRRFLYTHILEVGGRRTETAFMKLHVAVQHVVDWISQYPTKDPAIEEILARLEGIWDTLGPGDHGYSEEYKRIAQQLLTFYLSTRTGSNRMSVPELRLAVDGGEVIIRPDHVMSGASNKLIMRRVQTGHKKSKEEESLAAAAFRIAADSNSPGCVVELVHLSDETVTPIEMSAKVLGNRKNSISQAAQDIRAGRFPMEHGRTCPRCPAFFICGPLPAGTVNKKMLT